MTECMINNCHLPLSEVLSHLSNQKVYMLLALILRTFLLYLHIYSWYYIYIYIHINYIHMHALHIYSPKVLIQFNLTPGSISDSLNVDASMFIFLLSYSTYFPPFNQHEHHFIIYNWLNTWWVIALGPLFLCMCLSPHTYWLTGCTFS